MCHASCHGGEKLSYILPDDGCPLFRKLRDSFGHCRTGCGGLRNGTLTYSDWVWEVVGSVSGAVFLALKPRCLQMNLLSFSLIVI